MKQTMNYMNTFPDFLEMQRVSFCWFITQGLTEELRLYSRLQDFPQTTEYLMLGEEFELKRPNSKDLSIARKYDRTYSVRLKIPIEIRSTIEDTVCCFRTQFSILTLPLMTDQATFVLNGCERVIVSQIIRSPGVYFEQTKKFSQPFKRKLPTDLDKVGVFMPDGCIFLSEKDLFFSPKIISDPMSKAKGKKKPKIIKWLKKGLSLKYCLKYLKHLPKLPSVYFLQSFKYYCLILRTADHQSKSQLIQLFIKWVKLEKTSGNLQNQMSTQTVFAILKYFRFLLKLITKTEILEERLLKSSRTGTKNKLSKDQIRQLLSVYQKTLSQSQQFIKIQTNASLLLTSNSKNWLVALNNFSILKQNFTNQISTVKKFNELVECSNLRPTFYFSTTLQDLTRYAIPSEPVNPKQRRDFTHRHVISKTHYVRFRKDYDINTFYHQKYNEKDLYAATLIPDSGSWIRFKFQKNTKLTLYTYPIKNQEDQVIIQLDKVTSTPVLSLLKEIGLTDFEIYKNLQYSDFFYFDKPVLLSSKNPEQPISRFQVDSKGPSAFSKIFDAKYYRLGYIGRAQLNTRLNLNMSGKLDQITYEDIFAIVDKLVGLTVSNAVQDDIDHLKNKRIRPIGELLQSLFRVGYQRWVRMIENHFQTVTLDEDLNQRPALSVSLKIVNAAIKEFFASSQLSQYLDETNPLSSLTHRRRISSLGPGGLDRDRISFAVRDIHPSHYGRICPIETPEGQNVGLIASLTTCARVNKLGFLETPFWRVINGKVIKTGNPIYLTADVEDLYKIAPADLVTNDQNYLIKNLIPVRYNQDFQNVAPSEVDFISISPIQVVSVAASLIPFFEHDDANRALMGSNMQRQSVPLMLPQKPIVGTGLENQIAMDSGLAITAKFSGIVESVTADKIVIHNHNGTRKSYILKKYVRSNQQTCINQRPIVWKGESVQSGQLLTDGPAIASSELALGQNVLVAYMPWQGYNFEDAILISERLIYDNIFTSIHIERYKVPVDESSSGILTNNIPNLTVAEIQHLNFDGVVKVGTFVKPGDILVGRVIPTNNADLLPEAKLLRAIFGVKSKGVKDNSYRMPEREYGRVIDTVALTSRTRLSQTIVKIYIFIAQMRKIQVGDKIAGRHGNKGIISRILPQHDMPFLPDGTPVDIILNPLGVPSRMNVGQLYECLLGLAGDKLNSRFKILPFDEMYGSEMSRILINKKLRQASIQKNESWVFNPYAPGKVVLIDGRTGKEFENPITVGNAYMLKLIHLVDDKMHARATGPYSLITQQPLRGKAQHGGQRFGEMEVWALEGFGAAFTLQELLTIKSDDIEGRNETLSAIVRGQKLPKFGIPESFKVLLQELRSIGLDVSTHKLERFDRQRSHSVEVNLMENYNALSKTFSPNSNLNDISISF